MKRTSNKRTPAKKKGPLLEGTISIHPRGFGFVVVAEGEDVFIPKSRMKGALDGDRIQIRLLLPPPLKGPEGEVVKITKRKRSNVVGIVEKQAERNSWEIYAPLLTREKPVFVSGSKLALERGDRILATVEKWGDDAITTKFVKKFGTIEEPSLDIEAAIHEFELRNEFPKKALDEAKKIVKTVPASEIAKRKDLRKEVTFTIDPDTAKDFDDALHIIKTKEGTYRLGVHIADVSHYVKRGSPLDKEAEERANSTYFPGKCIPMLPHELSDGLCSLQPNKVRLTITVEMHFDQEGNLISFEIYKSAIKSKKRFTYKEAKKVLDKVVPSKFLQELELMVELALLLKKKRAARGSLEFSLQEYSLQIDEKGLPTGFELIEYDITHQLVEEFMLKANEVVAIHLNNQGKNLPYRIHDQPTDEAMEEFGLLARMAGYSLTKKPTKEELSTLFADVDFRKLLATQFIRRMKMAFYSTENIGHFGLQLTHYCHFTSPIRRYVDLVAHRILFGESDDIEHLDWLVQHTSERERISAKAESSVKILKKIRFAKQHFEEDPKMGYSAIVTKMKPFGLFFEVEEFALEGFFHISELGDDWWHFDAAQMQFIGERSGKKISLGAKFKVQINTVDLIHQEITWRAFSSAAGPKIGRSR